MPEEIRHLYAPKNGRVEFIEVPKFRIIAVDGTGAPESVAFHQAIEALYSVSYTAHFALKADGLAVPKVMPLEGLWSMSGKGSLKFLKDVVAGRVNMADSDRNKWRWSLFIVQFRPLTDKRLRAAIDQVSQKKPNPALAKMRVEQFQEGKAAQILHIGPYSDEARSLVVLHQAISDAGYRPKGAHHEIYLGDPRRAAPEKLKTILRTPIQ